MDRKFLIHITLVILLVLFGVRYTHAEQYYSSIYRHRDGDRYTLSFWNTRWQHIDNRIDALEGLGSNIFSTISVSGEDDVVADTSSDTLTLVAGSNVTLTNTASSDTIQIDVSTTPLDALNDGVEVVAGTTDLDFDANFSITDEGSNETGIALADDVTIAGFLTVTEYVDMAEMGAPPNPSGNVGRLYVADAAGTTTPYFLDNAGTATNLLTGSSDEAIQDLIGAMLSGNTETLITVTYQDADGTIDFVVSNDLHSYSWASVVDADITDTLTASIFKGSGSTTNAVDLATAEVAGILPASRIADAYIKNNANDTTSGNIQLYDAVGDSPQLNLTDASGESMQLAKIDGGVAAIYNDTGAVAILPSGDIDDYLSITTVANVPRISTGGASNLVISPSSGIIDLDGCAIIGMGGIATDDNLVLDDGIGDSPYLQFTDGDDNTFTIQKLDTGAASFINNEGSIAFYPSGDLDDYFIFSTSTNEPVFASVGSTSMNYGGASVTDHTFTSDSTGDAEFVVPNDSIGPAELDSTTGAYDFGGVTSFEIPNANDVSGNTAEGLISWDSDDDVLYMGNGSGVIDVSSGVGLGTNVVNDIHIDWGFAANQVSMVDLVDIKYIPIRPRLGVPENNLSTVDFREGRDGERLYAERTGISGSDQSSDLYFDFVIPADFGSWYTAGSDNIALDIYKSDGDASSYITVTVYDSEENADSVVNAIDVTPGSDTTWTDIGAADVVEITDTATQGEKYVIKFTTELDANDSFLISQGYLIYVPE